LRKFARKANVSPFSDRQAPGGRQRGRPNAETLLSRSFSWCATVDSIAGDPAGLEGPAAIGPGDCRSCMDHGLRDPQPRLHLYDTLYGQVGQSAGFKATSQMLADHTIENDGWIWELTLRDGLLFHDGERVPARDCAASIKRWGARDAFSQARMARTDEV